MADARTIYEQLTGVKVDDATIEQLDFTKNTFIDSKSIEYWKGVITISKIIDASRTYPHGLPIPEASAVGVVQVSAGDVGTFQPTGTEIWHVKAIQGTGVGGSATGQLSWYDGTTLVPIDTQTFTTGGGAFTDDTNFPITWSEPMILTNSLYFHFEETGAAAGLVFELAYHKVSL